MTAASRDLEILVAKIQAQLAPGAEVIHNARLPGRQSQATRQIDVLVRQRIGQYEMMIVLDCKDHARPIDVKGVEEFLGLMTDVGAHRGALVCPKGFTQAARTRASALGMMDLYSPIDTDPHKWQARVTAPAICDFRSARIAFGLSTSDPLPFTMQPDYFTSTVAFAEDGTALGSPFDAAIKKWNTGGFPIEAGRHDRLPIFDTPVKTDNGHGMKANVELTASLLVDRSLYYGHIPITRMSGFKDELSGMVITNAFQIGLIDPNEVEQEWTKIPSEAEAPGPVLLKLQGLIGWGA